MCTESVAHWSIFFQKLSRPEHSQWRALYRSMITGIFVHQLNGINVEELWLRRNMPLSPHVIQLKMACHTARVTINLFRKKPLLYLRWAYVKSLVYASRWRQRRWTTWKSTFAALLPIYGLRCSKNGQQLEDYAFGPIVVIPWLLPRLLCVFFFFSF